MENTKVNDWLVATLSAPNNSFGDFEQEDVTPNNTALKDKSVYVGNDTIKKAFTDDKGKFKQDEFDKFYDVALTTYNEFSRGKFDKTILNDTYYFKNDAFAPKSAKKYSETTFLEKVRNPFKSRVGMEGLNLVSTPDLSVRELAQQTEAKDGTSGKGLGWKPNDDSRSGLFDFWKNPTLVLGQYDEDGMHYDADAGREIKHKKGDFKTDDNGEFFYETLGSREVYGKTVLNVWDTNTTEGSFANKWDFMDSDGLNKSLTGILAKNVAKSIPYFLPGIGQYYAGLSVGLALMDALPALAKSTTGIFLGDSQKDTDFYKLMNKVQGVNRAISNDTSDYAKSGAFNTENLVGMVADVFEQLYQQRWIASVPQKLAASSKEAQILKLGSERYGTAFADDLKAIMSTEKDMSKRAEAIRKLTFDDPELIGIADKMDTWASVGAKALSTSYMAATSAIGVVAEAKAIGLDERDTAVLYLGTVAGFGAMMSKLDIGTYALKGLGLDDVAKGINKSINMEAGSLADSFAAIDKAILNDTASVMAKDTFKGKQINKIFELGKSLGKRVSARLNNVDVSDYGAVMLAEGTEEITEEVMQDSIKLIYDGMSSLGLTSTKDKEKQFNFTANDILSRYAMSGLGGAVGGALFKFNDKLTGDTFDQQDQETKKELIHIVRNGHAEAYLKKIDEREKAGTLGDTNLSPDIYDAKYKLGTDVTYKPAETPAQSQNAAIAALLRGQVAYVKNIIKQEAMPSDYAIQKVYDARVKLAIDINQHTAIKDDVAELSGQIVDKVNQIRSIGDVAKDDVEGELKNKTESTRLNKELLDLKIKLDKITSGEEYDKYHSEAMFNINNTLHNPYGVNTIDDLATNKYGKRFFELDETQKEEITEEFGVYNQYDRRKQLRIAKAEFDRINHDEVNKLMPAFADYAVQGYRTVNYQATMDKFNVTPQSVLELTKDNVQNIDMMIYLVDPDLDKITQIETILNNQKFVAPELAQGILDGVKSTKVSSLFESGLFTEFANYASANNLNTVGGILGHMSAELYNELDFDRVNNSDASNYDEAFDDVLKTLSEKKQHFTENYFTEGQYNELVSALTTFKDAVLTQTVGGQLITKSKQLLEMVKGKEKNPLYEWISGYLLKTENNKEGSNLIKLLADEFTILKSKESPTEYVLDGNVKMEQLENAKKLILKLHSVIQASTDFGYDLNHPSGFNSAINYVRKQNGNEDFLNVLMPMHNEYLVKDLAVMVAKIDFLINLSKINADNRIKNLKIASGVMRSLFLEAVGPEGAIGKKLEDLGLNLDKIRGTYINANQYKASIDSIRSTESMPFPSKDEELKQLEIEGVEIEKEFYNLLQSAPNKGELYEQILSTFDIKAVVSSASKNTDFSYSTKSVSQYDAYLYLNQIMNVDPIQFLNDFRGEKVDDKEFALEKSKYAPFYGQEFVLKMSYWLMKSQESDLDSFNRTLSYISLPEVVLPSQKDIFSDVIQTSLKNTIFIDGLPGSGKTSAVLNFIGRMGRDQGKTIAVYGPYKEQGENLQKSLEDLDNIVNDNKDIKSLLNQIMGNKDLHDRITKAMEDRDYDLVDIKDVSKVAGTEKLIVREDRGENFAFRLNSKNKEIADFLQGKNVSTITADGKVIDMIMIDEATHMSPLDLDILSIAVERHNQNNPTQKISLFLAGDTEQRGYTVKLDEKGEDKSYNVAHKYTMRTPKLKESLRAGYNVKINNIDVIRAYRSAYDDIVDNKNDVTSKLAEFIRNEKIVLKYTDKDGLIGDKVVDEITKEDIEKLVEENAKIGKHKIALIVTNPDSDVVKLAKEIPEFDKHFVIKTPKQVQGLEFDYTIVDIEPMTVNASSNYSLRRGLEMLYTMISRSKKGTLIKGNPLQGIDVSSTDKNVYAVNVELNADMIKQYKEFRMDAINSILDSITPSEFTKGVEPAKTQPSTPSVLTQLEQDSMYNMLFDQKKDENTFGKIDAVGVVEDYDFQDENVLTYPFHERLNVEILEATNQIKSVKNENSDLSVIHRILNGEDVIGKSLGDAGITNSRYQLRTLRSALYNYANYVHKMKVKGLQEESLSVYLSAEMNIPVAILEQLDFDNVKISIESKTYEVEYDGDTSNSLYRENEGGIIHFLVARVPFVNSDEDSLHEQDPDELDNVVRESGEAIITLAGFANRHNPNVKKFETVEKSLIKLEDLHKQSRAKSGEEVTYLNFNSDIPFEELVKPTSNLIFKTRETKGNVADLKKNNPLYVFSKVYIVMPTDFVKGDVESNEIMNAITSPKQLKDGTPNVFHNSMVGRPVMFVSADKTIPANDLRRLFVEQFQDSVRYRAERDAGKTPEPRKTRDTIKMIVLNPKGVKFSEWVNKNVEIYKKALNPNEVDIDAQRRAYGNGYIAARILANLNNFNDHGNITFKNKPTDKFDPYVKFKNIYKLDDYDNKDIDLLRSRVAQFNSTVFKLMIEMDKSFKPGDSAVPRPNSAEIESVRGKYFSTLPQDQGKAAAIKYIAKTIIYKKLKGRTPTDIVSELTDADGNFVKPQTFSNPELFNMVSAIRIALEGGKYKVGNSEIQIEPMFIGGSSRDVEKKKFLNALDKVMSYDFVDGLYIHPVLRKAVIGENAYVSNDVPFLVAVGNPDDHFEVGVHVTEANALFDLSGLELRSKEEVEGDNSARIELDKKNVDELLDNMQLVVNTAGMSHVNISKYLESKYDLGNITPKAIKDRLTNWDKLKSEMLDDALIRLKQEFIPNSIVADNNNKDDQENWMIVKDILRVDDALNIEYENFFEARDKYVTDVTSGYSLNNFTVTTGVINTRGATIDFSLIDNETSEKIATFVFKDGKFTNFVTAKSADELVVQKSANMQEFETLMNSLVIDDLVRPEFEEFKAYVSEVFNGDVLPNNLAELGVISKNAFMIAASIRKSPEQFEAFSKWYSQFIENYKC